MQYQPARVNIMFEEVVGEGGGILVWARPSVHPLRLLLVVKLEKLFELDI